MDHFRYLGAFALYLSSLVSQSCRPLAGLRGKTAISDNEVRRHLQDSPPPTVCPQPLPTQRDGWGGEVTKVPLSAVTSDSQQLLLLPPHPTEHLAVTAGTLGVGTALATVGGDTRPQVRTLFFNF